MVAWIADYRLLAANTSSVINTDYSVFSVPTVAKMRFGEQHTVPLANSLITEPRKKNRSGADTPPGAILIIRKQRAPRRGLGREYFGTVLLVVSRSFRGPLGARSSF